MTPLQSALREVLLEQAGMKGASFDLEGRLIIRDRRDRLTETERTVAARAEEAAEHVANVLTGAVEPSDGHSGQCVLSPEFQHAVFSRAAQRALEADIQARRRGMVR